MEFLNEKGKIDAEKVVSQIGQMQITGQRFKFPFDAVESCEWTLSHFYVAELRKRGRTVDIESLDEPTKAHIRKLSEWLVEGDKPAILLAGDVGNGKTTMLEAICKMCNKIYYSNWSVERRAWVWLNAIDIAESFGEEKYETCRQAEWLAIDDLGQEPAEIQNYGTVCYPIRDLILYRYERGLLTLMTTNLKPADIRQRYGGRVADRLNEMCQVEFYEEPSYRK